MYSDLYYLWKHGMIVGDNDGCKSSVDDERGLDDEKESMVKNCAAKDELDGEETTEKKIL